jgi:hypothetical protein
LLSQILNLYRYSPGNGTSYRMLRRNGPAPGTTDGGERGLAQFRLEAVMEGVTAAQLARVQMNDLVRAQWDTSLLHGDQLAVSEPSSSSTDGSELAFWRMKFPMPMAPRDYLFVRRRWQGAEDGAFYGVTRDATGAAGGFADSLAAGVRVSGGGYRVRRLYSGQRIRAVTVTPSATAAGAAGAGSEGGMQQQALQQPPRPASSSTSSTSTQNSLASPSASGAGGSCPGPAAELVSIYHEDSGVPAAVIALAACKGLLPFMRNLEAAARGSFGIEGAELAAGGRGGGRGGGRLQLRRLFGGKDSSSKRHLRMVTGWPARFARMSRSAARGELSLFGPKAGFSGENAVRVGRFGFRQGARRMVSKLKDGIHRTVHKAGPVGHENIHAEGRRRKLMVRAAGLVAMMAHVKKNRS